MLVFRLIVRKPLRAFLDNEPTRPARRVRQNRVRPGNASVADPLLIAIDLVPATRPSCITAVGRRAEGPQIASRFRFGGAVGEEQSFIGNAAQPNLLLLWSGANRDRITAEKSSQHRGRYSQVDPRHLLANAVHIEGATAHAAKLFRDEQH